MDEERVGGTPHDGPASLGWAVQARRHAAGLTQRQLAAAARVSVGVIRDVEQGLTARPRSATLHRLGAALGMSLAEIAALTAPPATRPRTAPGGHRVHLRVLGPLEAWRGSHAVTFGGGRQRALLGLLAAHQGAVLGRDTISAALWGDNPPPTATAMIHSYVSRLRRALGRTGKADGSLLVSAEGGYRLHAADGVVDAATFELLSARGRATLAAGDPAGACEAFEQALGLWRGEPLADIDILRTEPAVVRLARQRTATVIEYAEAACELGWHDRALPHLQALTSREPLNERACACAMIALAGCGEQAAALDRYEDLRRRLDDELGVRPGPELRAAHERVLRHRIPRAVRATARLVGQRPAPAGSEAPRPGPAVSGGSSGPFSRGAPPSSGPALPGADADRAGPDVPGAGGSQLPPTVMDFTGRDEALAAVVETVSPVATAVGVPVAVISGLPGAGKTALALHAAHTMRPAFPDGQLWAPLDGSTRRPRDPGEAVGELLRVLGVPLAAIPESAASRAALFRAQLADRRVLVVADDAASVSQVTPLLPGAAGSALIVTTRTTLAAPAGARLATLGALTREEAVDLLGGIAGRERVAAEPLAAASLADACGSLPLAIRIAGARLAARPSWPVSVLAGKVGDPSRRLDELQAGEMSVRARLADSYESLDSRCRRAFRLLALPGRADFAEWVVAALLGEADADAVVTDLSDRSLLASVGADATGQPRYRLHGLLRDYASELLALDPGPDRDAASARLSRAWLQLAALAGARVLRDPPTHTAAPTGPDVVPAPLAERLTADGAAWFEAERANLLVAAGRAWAAGDRQLATRLAQAQAGFHRLRGRHDDAEHVWRAIAAASRAG